MSSDTFQLYLPDGQPFADYIQVRLKILSAQLKQERQAKETVSAQLERERERAKRLEQLLREAGIDPDIASATLRDIASATLRERNS